MHTAHQKKMFSRFLTSDWHFFPKGTYEKWFKKSKKKKNKHYSEHHVLSLTQHIYKTINMIVSNHYYYNVILYFIHVYGTYCIMCGYYCMYSLLWHRLIFKEASFSKILYVNHGTILGLLRTIPGFLNHSWF